MATTTKITLTKVPQLIASGACYLQSRNGDFGNIYAWRVVEHPVSLFVTK